MFANDTQVLAQTELPIPYIDNVSISISFEMVTPKIAEEWLETNSDSQRNVNANIVRQYEAQMRKGLWKGDNGESVKFSKKGLIDGQHRLHAVIKFGKPVMLMIMRGLNDEDMIKTMDLGKKRSLGDILKIHGVETIPGMNENVLASVANGLYVAKHFMKVSRKDSESVRIDSNVKIRPTPLELYEFLKNNPCISERLEKLTKYKLATMAKNVSLSPTIVAWFLCDVIDEDVANNLILTMQECVPQTSQGKMCPAFKVLQYIQRQKAKNVSIHKHEYPGLFLWACDYILLNKEPSRVYVSNSHLPGQGHEGSVKLKRFFADLNDFE